MRKPFLFMIISLLSLAELKADDDLTHGLSGKEKIMAKISPEEQAIRKHGEAMIDAYNRGDAKELIEFFATNAEYIDSEGTIFNGKEAIEENLVSYFKENTDCKIEMTIDRIRIINSVLALEDGRLKIDRPNDESDSECQYSAVYVHVDGKWLTASLRDQAEKSVTNPRDELTKLDWLLGDWIDESDDSIITFSCEPVDNGNFLLRKFSVLVAGQEEMTGTQRIGWDPLTGKLRAWIFDSEGAFSEGQWARSGSDWLFKSSGTTVEGFPASSTSIYKRINDHTLTWQSTQHEIAGEMLPDSDVITLVRRAPTPLERIIGIFSDEDSDKTP